MPLDVVLGLKKTSAFPKGKQQLKQKVDTAVDVQTCVWMFL